MISYLLENNTENKKAFLTGEFKGFIFDGFFYKKYTWLYSVDRTIRLSTPEEKAKLDNVIAENEKELIKNSFKKELNAFKEDIEEFVSSHQETILKINSAIRKHKEEIKKLKYTKKIIQTLK